MSSGPIPIGAQRAVRGDPAAREAFERTIRERVAGDPDGAVKDLGALHDSIREEKSHLNYHQRRVRALRYTFAEFKRNLEAMGVQVILEPGPEQKKANEVANAT